MGIATAALAGRRCTLCRPCMDWSERRRQLAGALECALLSRVCEFKWAKRVKGSRVIHFTPRRQRSFLELFASARPAPRLAAVAS